MKHVKIEKDKCIIELNKTFYPEKIIRKAIEEFNKTQEGNLDKKEDKSQKQKIEYDSDSDKIIINDKDKDFAYEFCDYLLGFIHGGSSDGFERV
jgi:hypothetical protein